MRSLPLNDFFAALPSVEIEFGTLNGETILLAIALSIVIFLLVIRAMMRTAMSEQISNFDKFKIEIARMLGETASELKSLRNQAEASSRAYEKRIEEIEHNQVRKEDFFRENTLIKSAYDDLNRYIYNVSNQLENLKYLLLQKNESKSSNKPESD